MKTQTGLGRAMRSAGEYSSVVGRGRIGAAAIEVEVDAIVDCLLRFAMLLLSIHMGIEHESDAMECDGGNEKIALNVILLASSLQAVVQLGQCYEVIVHRICTVTLWQCVQFKAYANIGSKPYN
jgi:hypothetical protein